jgi:hypothetical protein
MKRIWLRALSAAGIATAFLWVASAYVLYLVVMPLRPSGNGTSMMFDPVALAYATSIIVAIAILSWLPVFLLLRQGPAVHVAILTSVLTFASLGILFLLVENNVLGALRYSDGFYYRAARVLGDGRDMAFLPFVDPLISVLSGLAHTAALWLSILFSRRNRAPFDLGPENVV